MYVNRFHALQAEEVVALIKRNLLEISNQYYPPDYVAAIAHHLSPAKLIEKGDQNGFLQKNL